MKVAIVGYRDWARNLCSLIQMKYDSISDRQMRVQWFDRLPFTPQDLTFFVGWSEMVPEDYYRDNLSLVLHPSPLPRYRGGSPIQHQILAGETTSAVTLFKIDPGYPAVDSGPIAWQMAYSLEGYLPEILERITRVGARGVLDCIGAFEENRLTFVPQPRNTYFPPYKRRTPEQSEIKVAELSTKPSGYLLNKVRALQSPYPEAFIRTADGKRLILERVRVEEPPVE